MGKNKEDQPGLWLNNEFKISGYVSNMENGSHIMEIASKRDIWKQKDFDEKSNGRYFDLRSYDDVTIAIENRNWYIIPSKYCGLDTAVIICNPLDEENIKGVQSAAKDSLKKIKKEGPLLIFEEKGGILQKDKKLLLLKDVGLIERAVLTGISRDFNLLEGRKKSPRKPIDLLDINKYPRSLKQCQDSWKEMVQMYREKGFVIVDPKNSPIIEKLHSSTYPSGDKQKLKNGFGVRVKDVHCGCTFDVNLRGAFNVVWSCSTHHEERKHPEV